MDGTAGVWSGGSHSGGPGRRDLGTAGSGFRPRGGSSLTLAWTVLDSLSRACWRQRAPGRAFAVPLCDSRAKGSQWILNVVRLGHESSSRGVELASVCGVARGVRTCHGGGAWCPRALSWPRPTEEAVLRQQWWFEPPHVLTLCTWVLTPFLVGNAGFLRHLFAEAGGLHAPTASTPSGCPYLQGRSCTLASLWEPIWVSPGWDASPGVLASGALALPAATLPLSLKS